MRSKSYPANASKVLRQVSKHFRNPAIVQDRSVNAGIGEAAALTILAKSKGQG